MAAKSSPEQQRKTRWRDIESGDDPPAHKLLDGKDIFYHNRGPCSWDGARRDDSGRPRLIFLSGNGDDYYIQYWKERRTKCQIQPNSNGS